MRNKRFAGTRQGGDFADPGTAYLNGEPIARVPIQHINMSPEQFEAVVAAFRRVDRILGREEVAALLDDGIEP